LRVPRGFLAGFTGIAAAVGRGTTGMTVDAETDAEAEEEEKLMITGGVSVLTAASRVVGGRNSGLGPDAMLVLVGSCCSVSGESGHESSTFNNDGSSSALSNSTDAEGAAGDWLGTL
jgi:hypothetical protein